MDNQSKDHPQYGPGGENLCIQCGKCLEVCPVLDATGSEELAPRSKLVLLKHLAQSPRDISEKEAAKLASLCLTCGKCAKACPQGTNVPAAVAHVRSRSKGFTTWLWKHWIGQSSMLWPTAAKTGRIIGKASSSDAARKLCVLNSYPRITPWLGLRASTTCPSERKALLFPGCLAGTVRTDWTRKANKLLETAGTEAVTPKWECCGGTLHHAGLVKEAKQAAAANIRIWRDAGRPQIVTFCASCAHSLASYPDIHPSLFNTDEAGLWGQAQVSLFEMLDSVRFELLDDAPAAVTYHKPCHAPDDDPAEHWLRKVSNNLFAPAEEQRCCGMGGILQLGAPKLSKAIGTRLWDNLDDARAQVLTACSGCWMQLAATAPDDRKAGHLLDAVTTDTMPSPQKGLGHK